MFNMDKITRTKLAMLVTLVLMNIFTTIALYYMMTVSNVSNIGSGDSAILNMAMVFAVMIAYMWVVILVLFYEFKTDDLVKTHVTTLEKRVADLIEFKQMLNDTVYTPVAINSDIFKDGGINGHTVPPK